MILLLGVIWPVSLGYLLVRALGRTLPRFLQICLAPALGIGIVSCCFFLELESGIPALLFELLVLGGAGAACWKIGWRRPAEARKRGALERWLWAPLGIALAGAAGGFLAKAFNNPHGDWDAWAIWNLHARFLVTAYWRDLFSSTMSWSHPDYPLLLPAFIARVWSVGGERDLLTPLVVAFLFTFGAIGLLGETVGALKGRTQGLIAAFFLAATPAFAGQGAMQCADIPLSFFILATVALLALQDRDWPQNRGISVLAGLCAGMAAWTKNEGLLLVALLLPIRVLAVWRQRGMRTAGAQMVWLTAGLAPVMAVVLFFRLTLAPPNAHLGGRSATALARLLVDGERWKVMLVELARGVERLGGLPIGIPVVLAAYLVCAGLEFKRDRIALVAGFALLAALLAGYCIVCVISPYEIRWLTDTALFRLLLQLWPATVFLTFVAARPRASDTAG